MKNQGGEWKWRKALLKATTTWFIFPHFLSTLHQHRTECVCQKRYSITVEIAPSDPEGTFYSLDCCYHDDYGWLRGWESGKGRKEGRTFRLAFSCCCALISTTRLDSWCGSAMSWKDFFSRKNFFSASSSPLSNYAMHFILSERHVSVEKQKNIL